MLAVDLCGRRDDADENKRLAMLTVPTVLVAPIGLRRGVAAGAFVREGDEGGGFRGGLGGGGQVMGWVRQRSPER